MSEDLKEILNLSSHISDINKKKKAKKDPDVKKKPGKKIKPTFANPFI